MELNLLEQIFDFLNCDVVGKSLLHFMYCIVMVLQLYNIEKIIFRIERVVELEEEVESLAQKNVLNPVNQVINPASFEHCSSTIHSIILKSP